MSLDQHIASEHLGDRRPRVYAEAFIDLVHRRSARLPADDNDWDGQEGGSLVARRRGGDTVVTPGLDLLNRLTGTTTGVYSRVILSAIGTGVAAVGSNDTELGSEVYRGTFTWSKDSPRGSASMDRTFTIGSTYSIRESALVAGTSSGFYSGTARGTMYSRGTFAVRNVVNGDTLTLNYTQGFTAG